MSMETTDITRRGFVAGATAAAAGAALASSGVALAADAKAKTPMTPGTYTGQARGYAGTIVVEVKVSADAIESVEVTDNVVQPSTLIPSEDENPYAHYAWMVRSDSPQILNTAAERLPQRIVDAQSLAVDSVCGATLSSMGIKDAVADAITQAGGDPDDFSAAPEKSGETVDLGSFDVIVVGAGTSGTMAAARATDLGAKVLLVEKSGRVGGTGALSSEPCTLGAKMQLEQGFEFDVHGYYESLMAMNHWSTNGQLMMKFLSNSGSTIDWMMEKADFPFHPEDLTNPEAAHESDRLFGNCLVGYTKDSVEYLDASEAWQRLAEPVDTVQFETEVTGVTQDADGNVCGITGVRWDGATVTASAPAVIFSCGGFAGDAELMEKYNGANYNLFGLYQNQGTTLKLLTPLGAKEEHVGGMCAHYTDVVGEIDDSFTDIEKNALFSIHAAQTFLHVNSRGERFCNENEKAVSMLSSSAYAFAQGPQYYTIFSQAQVDAMREGGLAATGLPMVAGVAFFHYGIPVDEPLANIDAILDDATGKGFVHRAETLDELAEQVGFDARTFAENVATYEEACVTGVDEVFGKDATFLFPMGEEGPFYALTCTVRPYNTLGGVKTDANLRVLDTEGHAMGGLYATGVDAIGNILDGVFYPDHLGIAFGFGLNSGRIAAETAVADVLGK